MRDYSEHAPYLRVGCFFVAVCEIVSFERLFRWQSLCLVGKAFQHLSIDLIVLLQWE